MKVADLPYEFFRKNLPRNDGLVASPGEDDCSVIQLPDQLLITTTDFVNSRPASFTLGIGDLDDIGYLAVIANLSDLLGTGATPVGFLLGVQLSVEHTEADYEKVLVGALRCLDEYGVPLLGGDTKKGPSLSVYGVGIGTANASTELFLSNRATPGDPILLSGPVGAFNAAVFALSQSSCPANIREACVEAVLKPVLAVKVARDLSRTHLSRAGTDISDGLGADLSRLAQASRVGLLVSSKDIPLSPLAITVGKTFEIDPIKFAFATGGDYQFVATGPSVPGTYQIGKITQEDDGCTLEHLGRLLPFPTEGHDDSGMATFTDEIDELIKKQPF